MTDFRQSREAASSEGRGHDAHYAHLAALLDSTDDYIWTVDPVTFGLQTFNRKVREFFLGNRGITLRMGQTPGELLDPAVAAGWISMYLDTLRLGSMSTELVAIPDTLHLFLTLHIIESDGVPIGISVFGKNISAYKSAEKQILNQRQRQERLLQQLPAGIVVRGADGVMTFVNEKAAELFGVRPEEVVGNPHFEAPWVFVSEDGSPLPRDEAPYRRVLRSGRPIRDLVLGIDFPWSATRVWTLVHAFEQVTEEENRQVVVTFVDITERKSNELALRQRLEYETLIADLAAGFLNLHGAELERAIETAQKKVCDMFDLDIFSIWLPMEEDPQELVMTKLFRRVVRMDLPEVMKASEYFPWMARRLRETGRSVATYTHDLPAEATRDRRSAEAMGITSVLTIPAMTPDGRLSSVVGLNSQRSRPWKPDELSQMETIARLMLVVLGRAREEQEREKSQETLRVLNEELEQRVQDRTAALADLYNNAPCGYHSLDAAGTFVRVNDTELRWLGYTRDELLGRIKAVDLFTPASRMIFETEFLRFKTLGLLDNLELEMIRKDGSIMAVLLSATAVRDADGNFLMSRSTIIDFTERRRAAAALLASQRQLEATNRELESFSYSVSHDLRAPLRTVNGFTRMILEDHAGSLDDEGRRLFEVVQTHVAKMDRLIVDVLELTRISRGELRRSRLCMGDMARMILRDLAAPELQRNLRCIVHDIPDADADGIMMHQVWSNLLSNAITFTSPKPDRVIEVGGSREEGRNVYFVKDNGVGFDDQYAHKLFGIFQRLHSESEFKGTGVGLAIVQRIVHRHGGEVWAESVLNEGATFYFSLPRYEL